MLEIILYVILAYLLVGAALAALINWFVKSDVVLGLVIDKSNELPQDTLDKYQQISDWLKGEKKNKRLLILVLTSPVFFVYTLATELVKSIKSLFKSIKSLFKK